ncbi:MAG: hypothetical protein ACPG32_10700 [Akkermansiaceae bacterium]
MRADFRTFRGVWSSFDQLFAQAADFASAIGPERLISISHSEDKDDGVVTVWYWTTTPSKESTGPHITIR